MPRCAVAGEHLLVVGAPGTANSEAVRRTAAQLGGRYFEYILGRFTEPNEIFGPVDLRGLREGVVEIETSGMLPEADVAFLDEVFLGSTAILNTLLGVLNERTVRRGSTNMAVPLRVCVGATNVLPEDPALAAFADRFLATLFVAPVVGAAIRRLRGAGIAFTDRRAVRAQRLVAAAAVLDGRTYATPSDLWVLPIVAPEWALADEFPVEFLRRAWQRLRSWRGASGCQTDSAEQRLVGALGIPHAVRVVRA